MLNAMTAFGNGIILGSEQGMYDRKDGMSIGKDFPWRTENHLCCF